MEVLISEPKVYGQTRPGLGSELKRISTPLEPEQNWTDGLSGSNGSKNGCDSSNDCPIESGRPKLFEKR